MQPPILERLFGVSGKTVLITGGSSGIGLMLAGTFVAAGARVYVTGRDKEALQRTVAALAPQGQIHAIDSDLATTDGMQSVIRAIAEREPRLHVLINNAGATWGTQLEKFPDKAWNPVMTLNVHAPFALVQGLLPQLTAAASDEDPARVINIGSVYATTTHVMLAYSYAASKAAVHQLTRVLACELAPRRILVNAIAPGLFPSKMTNFALKDEVKHRELMQEVPLGRTGSPEDIGGLALMLASRAGAYMTGNIIPLDGGLLVAH